MDRNWNRGGASGAGGEKMHKQTYQRKKNDYNGQEYYNKKPVPSSQPLKKEGLQVALVENELMDSNFSWLKNVGICV